MKHWKNIAQAFENLGSELRYTCLDLGEMSQENAVYEEMYAHYCLVLSTLTAQVRWLNMKLDGICYEQENDQGE